MMNTSIRLTELEKDALKETANIGAGNASAALSRVIKRKINLVVSNIDYVPLSTAGSCVLGPKKLVVGIYTSISKGLQGNLIAIFPVKNALLLARTARRSRGKKTSVLTKADEKALEKIGDVLSASYFASLGMFLGVKLRWKPARLVSTCGESILDLLTLQLDSAYHRALIVNTLFQVDLTPIKGELKLLLAVESLPPLLKSIQEKLVE